MAQIVGFIEEEKRKYAITSNCGLKIFIEYFGITAKNIQIVSTGGYDLEFFRRIFPFYISELRNIEGVEFMKVIEITETSFDLFWEKYDYKLDKKRALAIWNKMKEIEKRKAVAYIPIYEAKNRKHDKKHAKTYLSSECWNDE